MDSTGKRLQAVAERGSLTLCGESFGSLPVFGIAFTEWQYDDILHICFVSQFQKKKKKKKRNAKLGNIINATDM
jgi:hypothetical protein